MSKHSNTRDQLYDYVRNDLPPREHLIIEGHLIFCKSCNSEVKELENIIESTILPFALPSAERSSEFWQKFYVSIERKIQYREKLKPATSFWDDLLHLVIFRKRLVIGFSTLVLLLISVITIWRQGIPLSDMMKANSPSSLPAGPVEINQRMEEYFNKSKTLLVGITNMDLDDYSIVDFSSEQKVSRALVDETRFLQHQPIDVRSARLVGDLEKILIELANVKNENGRSNIEIIKSGIHRGNILFKVRMAESMYESSRFMNVNHTSQGDKR